MMFSVSSARSGGLGTAWQRMAPGSRLVALALVGWTLAALALALADVAGIGGGEGASEPERRTATPGIGAPSLAAILDRPLFSASRRPDAVAPVMAPGPPARPVRDRRITLKGVYIDGSEAKAFVTSADKPEGVWVSRGSAIGDWRITGVSAEEVRLAADGESFSAAMPAAGHP